MMISNIIFAEDKNPIYRINFELMRRVKEFIRKDLGVVVNMQLCLGKETDEEGLYINNKGLILIKYYKINEPSNYREFMSTCLHECRHVWQHKTDEEYFFSDYSNDKDNYEMYYNSTAEKDARAYAFDAKDKVFIDDLIDEWIESIEANDTNMSITFVDEKYYKHIDKEYLCEYEDYEETEDEEEYFEFSYEEVDYSNLNEEFPIMNNYIDEW